jgi:hypothetical protein
MDPSPPGNGEGAVAGARTEIQTFSGKIIVEQLKPVKKKLLENYGSTWLFEVHFPTRVRYWVEQADKKWEFGLLYSARAKFERLARTEGYQ